MCLKINSKILTAQKPIQVFKVLVRDEALDLYSPYQSTEYREGEEKTVKAFGFRYFQLLKNFLGQYVILFGHDVYEGLHAYRSYANAKRDAYYRKQLVVECIIPKGARYIIGEWGDVVSTKLVVGEVKYEYGTEINE